MSIRHALGFHDWVAVWHDGWSSLFHKVGYECRVPVCKARKEDWPSWEDGHNCDETKREIADYKASRRPSDERVAS